MILLPMHREGFKTVSTESKMLHVFIEHRVLMYAVRVHYYYMRQESVVNIKNEKILMMYVLKVGSQLVSRE